MVLKIRPPSLDTEVPLLKPGGRLISFIQPAQNKDLVDALAQRKATVLGEAASFGFGGGRTGGRNMTSYDDACAWMGCCSHPATWRCQNELPLYPFPCSDGLHPTHHQPRTDV